MLSLLFSTYTAFSHVSDEKAQTIFFPVGYSIISCDRCSFFSPNRYTLLRERVLSLLSNSFKNQKNESLIYKHLSSILLLLMSDVFIWRLFLATEVSHSLSNIKSPQKFRCFVFGDIKPSFRRLHQDVFRNFDFFTC